MNRCEDFPCCGHYDVDGTFCPPQWDDEYVAHMSDWDRDPEPMDDDEYAMDPYVAEDQYLDSYMEDRMMGGF